MFLPTWIAAFLALVASCVIMIRARQVKSWNIAGASLARIYLFVAYSVVTLFSFDANSRAELVRPGLVLLLFCDVVMFSIDYYLTRMRHADKHK